VPDGRTTATTAANRDSTYALAGHVIDAMTVGPATFTPGLRVESIRSRHEDALSGQSTSAYSVILLPGAGAYLGLTKDFGVLGGVYRGFSPPPPGDPNANPESSINYEAGARYASKGFRAEVIGFYNDYSNITDICTFSNGCVNQNLDRQFEAGSARIYGFESYVEAAPSLRWGLRLPFRASYTLTRTEFLSDFESADPILGHVAGGDEMPYVPSHQASGSAGLETKRWGLNVAATYVGSMREKAGQGEPAPNERTDAYFVLDASGIYRFARWFQVYLNGRNLLNDAYLVSRRPFGARPGAPLWVQAGVKAEF
jgi:Fe(3+) dicitrate transport protein